MSGEAILRVGRFRSVNVPAFVPSGLIGDRAPFESASLVELAWNNMFCFDHL